MIRPTLNLALLAGTLALAGCLQDDAGDRPAPKGKEMIFTLNSDYKTGSYSTASLDGKEVQKDLEAVGSDAVVRYLGGKDIFILNRLGRDNAQVVDRENLKTVLQFSFPALSNPYDIVLEDSLLYVGFFGLAKVLVYHQGQGDLKDSLDLAPFADTVDGKPEVMDLEIDDGKLYVLVSNLDAKNRFSPLQARLVRFDLATKAAEAIDLPYGQPSGFALDAVARKLYIPCRGVWFKPDYTLELDAGVVSVDLGSFEVTDTLATEASLGGTMGAPRFHDGKLYLDLTVEEGGATLDKIVAFAPSKGAPVTALATLEGYQYGGFAIDGDTGTLYVGDRKQGLRIIDLATGSEKPESKVSLGALPINDLVLVK
jgi:hypothetical protein